MADKFINETGLLTIKQWIEGKFALDSDVDELAAEVQELITEGGEPNVIETVKVNGTSLTPDENKAVDVTVPTSTSDLTNDGDGESNFATEDYVDQNGGKIDTISVNGTQQTITNKNVNITVPTDAEIKQSFVDIATEYDLVAGQDVQYMIDSALTSAMTYKGAVATVADLPATGNKVGDFYDVTATGQNFAWNGTAWDECGALVDTSALWTSTAGQSNTLVAMTVAEINAILNPSS